MNQECSDCGCEMVSPEEAIKRMIVKRLNETNIEYIRRIHGKQAAQGLMNGMIDYHTKDNNE